MNAETEKKRAYRLAAEFIREGLRTTQMRHEHAGVVVELGKISFQLDAAGAVPMTDDTQENPKRDPLKCALCGDNWETCGHLREGGAL